MCGRYALYGPTSRTREQFDLDDGFDFAPRHNIPPTTNVLVVQSGPDGGRVARPHRWGLIPSWAKDVTIGAKLINARGETVAEKPAFRAAFRCWRCIVPANGFYEWKPVQDGSRTIKQPYFIRPQDEGDLFGFAGLTERWVSPEGEEVHTCCIITTDANALMMPIHDRMPVILQARDYGAWLEPGNAGVNGLQELLRPADAGDMIAYSVCRAVNSSRSDSPKFVEPA
ncbi:SOS response-associated peptidase [Candidatus Accumulibacter phosphatis]|uniref:Abasic site processing protein n=1 Tax=Candidatus Accumulibacter contiguus TaxID=2954381 RepID=A0ABX1TD01_9PROT|nr:SOS response-associated peptidase [Candidatus Accumulibacter contiguus]NMQ06258.1 SOS response-associated peptidase [Candidatus Accumulibacter contiguus]